MDTARLIIDGGARDAVEALAAAGFELAITLFRTDRLQAVVSWCREIQTPAGEATGIVTLRDSGRFGVSLTLADMHLTAEAADVPAALETVDRLLAEAMEKATA